jgi:hypothetical protein
MSKAKRTVSIELNAEDIAKALMGVMPNYWNKERLAKFISNVVVESGNENASELIKRINGILPEHSYPIGMNLLVSEYAISTWDVDKDAMIEKDIAVQDEGRWYARCRVIDIDIDSANPYLINYTVITSKAETKHFEKFVSEKNLISNLIEI